MKKITTTIFIATFAAIPLAHADETRVTNDEAYVTCEACNGSMSQNFSLPDLGDVYEILKKKLNIFDWFKSEGVNSCQNCHLNDTNGL